MPLETLLITLNTMSLKYHFQSECIVWLMSFTVKCRFDSENNNLETCRSCLSCIPNSQKLIAGQSTQKTEIVLHSGPHSFLGVCFYYYQEKEVKFQSRIESSDLNSGCVFCKTGRWGNRGRNRWFDSFLPQSLECWGSDHGHIYIHTHTCKHCFHICSDISRINNTFSVHQHEVLLCYRCGVVRLG